MEKLSGRTLHDLLEERGRLDPFEAVVYTRQILDAMGYAHQRGIIHRDLKPDNIFLHGRTQTVRSALSVKVIDFGLAKLLAKTDHDTKFRKLEKDTLDGVFVGTPRYAAPEQFAPGLPVDERTDLYAIALLLYRMIVGSDPFDVFPTDMMADAKLQFSAQTMVGHLNSLADAHKEPALKQLALELLKNLEAIIKKALQRHPKHRYQHASDFDAALAGIERALLARKPFVRGQSCGPYTIVTLRARGDIGDVYLAHDDELKRQVAIKTLKLVQQTEQEQRALLEGLRQVASVLAQLKHPNLPTIYMAQETSGRYWMATELVTGNSLRQLRKSGPLPARDVARHAIDIASGLSAAHAEGILHLDLKPSNVLVTGAGRAIVIDLGMAQALYQQASADTEAVHGSLAYTAPELLKPHGHEQAAPCSDIYSLGVILYELLAEHPYQTVLDEPVELMRHHSFVNPEPLDQRRTDVSKDLCDVITRCLCKAPADRFQQMADVVAALESTINGPHPPDSRALLPATPHPATPDQAEPLDRAADAPSRSTLRLGTNTSLSYPLVDPQTPPAPAIVPDPALAPASVIAREPARTALAPAILASTLTRSNPCQQAIRPLPLPPRVARPSTSRQPPPTAARNPSLWAHVLVRLAAIGAIAMLTGWLSSTAVAYFSAALADPRTNPPVPPPQATPAPEAAPAEPPPPAEPEQQPPQPTAEPPHSERPPDPPLSHQPPKTPLSRPKTTRPDHSPQPSQPANGIVDPYEAAPAPRNAWLLAPEPSTSPSRAIIPPAHGKTQRH